MGESIAFDAMMLAEATAAEAGVDVVELRSVDAMVDLCALLDRVWRPEPGDPMISPKLLRVLSHSGGYVVGVFAAGQLVGACVGLLAADGLHSHIAGVYAGLRGRGIGHAIKLHQRAWALERGITAISWTFDPLVSRNAHVNLAKLGALPTEYLPNFYGTMHDEVNAGTETDRLLVRWDLTGPRPPRPDLDNAVVGLGREAHGRPLVGRLDVDGGPVLVGVPADIESVRRADRALAAEWRRAVREVLGGLMARGRVVTGFSRDGHYVVEERGPEGSGSADDRSD